MIKLIIVWYKMFWEAPIMIYIYIYPISRKKGNHKNDIPTLVKHSTKGSLKWALDSSGKHHPELTLLIWIYPRNQMQCGPLVNSDR